MEKRETYFPFFLRRKNGKWKTGKKRLIKTNKYTHFSRFPVFPGPKRLMYGSSESRFFKNRY